MLNIVVGFVGESEVCKWREGMLGRLGLVVELGVDGDCGFRCVNCFLLWRVGMSGVFMGSSGLTMRVSGD